MRPVHAAIVLALTSLTAPALADPGDAQGQAREQRKAGHVWSLRQIEQRILPQMRNMQYLGPEYDPTAMAYRLKFIQNGRVFFVDVDARSGQIISKSR